VPGAFAMAIRVWWHGWHVEGLKAGDWPYPGGRLDHYELSFRRTSRSWALRYGVLITGETGFLGIATPPLRTRTGWRPLVVGLRPRQWVKNLLVFAAPLAAGRLFQTAIVGSAMLAFVAFCAASAATYLINDVADADFDREHPIKRNRPIASGALSSGAALGVATVLAVAAACTAFIVSWQLLVVIVTYIVSTAAYSARLKHEPVVDLALVSSGFLLRAIAGGAATEISLSRWFLIVAAFGSLFLVAGKRYSELVTMGDFARRSLQRYSPSYLRFVFSIAAGVTITAYCLWAFETHSTASVPWSQLTVAPFVLVLLRVGIGIDGGSAEAPDEMLVRDPAVLALSLLWLGLFTAGVYAS
jgi:decaprenyl-phosphate phosphoribosyltransferase